jgi:hypothetical protein
VPLFDSKEKDGIFNAIANEAEFGAEHIALGVRALCEADYRSIANYYQAFYSLSLGFERTSKLLIMIDKALTQKGKFPSEESIRNYGHNLAKLLNAVDSVSIARGLTSEWTRLPSDSIHNAIIAELNKFSDNVTRYYNIEFLTNPTVKNRIKDPILSWYDNVTTKVLARHLKQRSKQIIETKAKFIGDMLSENTLSRTWNEKGEFVNNIYEESEWAQEVVFARKYVRMYVLQIARFLSCMARELTYISHKAGLEVIPDLIEIYGIFCNEDDLLKRRKTWDIYHKR